MSAITGIFMRNGKEVDPELMKKMNDKLSHRGPDGSSVWCEGPIGLGHQMLWTTPESLHEVLPLEEDGLVITADARIDNRAELSEELDIRDEEDVADSYFILKAYAKWGDDCPDKLLGDFAFAVWDKNEEKLFCARDHMGVKPFYYYLDDDMFVFGTEIKALFANLEIPKKLNELRVADYLTAFFEDKEITFYEKIKRLPAACTFAINFNKEYLKNYWIIDIKRILNLNSNKEYSDAFRNIFTESVRCRLRSAYHIGSTLSGGLDSSSIVCTAKRILPEYTKLNTFSAVFDSVPQSDESYFINTVLKKGGLNPNFIHGDEISPLSDIDKVLWHLDEPLYTPNLFINWNIYIKAHNKGIRVILDGFDGDSTISHGEKYLAELAQNMNLKTLISEIFGLSKNLNIGINKIVFYQVITPLIPLTMKNFLIKKWNFIKNNNNFNGMELNTDFINRTNISKRYETLKQKNTNVSREYHYNYIKSGIHQFVLEVLDKSSSAYSLEPRYPFFDARLIEFCLSLPTEQKIFRGWDRIILRRSMEGILPQEVQWRQKKANLGHNFKKSFILYEKDNMKKSLLDTNKIKNFVNIENLNKTYENKIQNNTFNVWKTVNLALWLNKTDFSNYDLIKICDEDYYSIEN